MTEYKHLFVMDSPENLNMKLDSSLRLAQALLREGHKCAITTPQKLSWFSNCDTQVTCEAAWLSLSEGSTPTIHEHEKLDATQFHGIHMRKDPPFDNRYISCTWILSYLEKTAVVYNAPTTLRSLNEKLAIFDFPEASKPALLSADPEEISTFIKDYCHGDGILKPLDLFGGRGVIRLQSSDADFAAKIADATDHGCEQRIIQPFDQNIYKGEVRAFTAGGETISWCLKVPADGQYLANTRSGAVVQPYKPTATEAAMVQEISASLLKRGVFFVGYDLIGGFVSEINITSPRLLVDAATNERPLYERIAALVKADLDSRLGDR